MALTKEVDRGRGIICGNFCSLLHVVIEIEKNWSTLAPGELLPGRVQIPLSRKRISSIMKFVLISYDLLQCQYEQDMQFPYKMRKAILILFFLTQTFKDQK